MKARYLGVLLAVLVGTAAAQETGFAVRSTELKAEPFSDAATVTTLPEKAQVRIVARQGGWMRVESQGSTGWVRMLSVRMALEGKGSGDSGIKSLFNVARTGSSGTAVATGVRGLDKEQIQNAMPNEGEVERMGQFAASQPDAERFAAGKPALKAQPVEYFPAGGASANQ